MTSTSMFGLAAVRVMFALTVVQAQKIPACDDYTQGKLVALNCTPVCDVISGGPLPPTPVAAVVYILGSDGAMDPGCEINTMLQLTGATKMCLAFVLDCSSAKPFPISFQMPRKNYRMSPRNRARKMSRTGSGSSVSFESSD